LKYLQHPQKRGHWTQLIAGFLL